MKITPVLLEKYGRGECSEKERLAVEHWMLDPDSEMLFPDEKDLHEQKEKIWSGIRNQSFKQSKLVLKRWWLRPFVAAACFVVICGFALVFYKQQHQKPVQVVEMHYRVIKTEKGEKRNIILPDGTEVNLNADSQISFPKQFSDSIRLVFLSGEAFFSVKKDSLHPFRIQTSQAQIQVLGTRFNLNAYPDQKLTTVVVEEGKVQFSNINSDQKPLVLTKNQRGRLSKKDGLQKDNVYANRYMSWQHDKLIFDNENIADIAKTLERWYGIKVSVVSKHTASERFTGEFENRSLDYVIEKMSYVMQFHYENKGKTLTIY